MSINQPIQVTANVARACEVIRDGIRNGTYPGGAWIREMVIAEQAQVSRTSVRQALNVLALEGFVEIHPNRGAMVIDWSDDNLLLRRALALAALGSPQRADAVAALDGSLPDAARLQALRRQAGDIAVLLEAARQGVDAALRRMAELDALRSGLGTYGDDGRRQRLRTQARTERRL